MAVDSVSGISRGRTEEMVMGDRKGVSVTPGGFCRVVFYRAGRFSSLVSYVVSGRVCATMAMPIAMLGSPEVKLAVLWPAL